MASLPQELPWHMADNRWASILNPVVANPIIQGLQLSNISLTTGVNVINHKLSRKLQGWFITGINAPATIYDSQASNQTPQLTLVLNSDASAIVNVWVY